MKRKLLPISLIALFISTMFITQSCDKVTEAAEFDVKKELPTVHFDLDSASTKEVVILYEDFFDINLDSILEANGVDKGKVKDGKFESITISIDNPTPEMQLGFITELDFKVASDESFEDAEVLASAHDIKIGDTKIEFKVSDKALDKYIEMSKFYFRLYGEKVGEIPVETLPLLLDAKVKFTVSPLS